MISLADLPSFDWKTLVSAVLGAVIAWVTALLAGKKNK